MPTMPESAAATLVLGCGNPIMADDGLGIAVLERLQRGWRFPPEVQLVDGGTWGVNLLPAVESTGRLLLLDAIRSGLPPGTLVTLTGTELPRFFAHKLSPHQIDLREVLALAELRGTVPATIVALGAEPELIDMRASLSPSVEVVVEELARRAVAQLSAWGHEITPQPALAHA